jgi:hypothetical protein
MGSTGWLLCLRLTFYIYIGLEISSAGGLFGLIEKEASLLLFDLDLEMRCLLLLIRSSMAFYRFSLILALTSCRSW